MDGRARPQCAIEALFHLRDPQDSILFLHDFWDTEQRGYYKLVLHLYEMIDTVLGELVALKASGLTCQCLRLNFWSNMSVFARGGDWQARQHVYSSIRANNTWLHASVTPSTLVGCLIRAGMLCARVSRRESDLFDSLSFAFQRELQSNLEKRLLRPQGINTICWFECLCHSGRAVPCRRRELENHLNIVCRNIDYLR